VRILVLLLLCLCFSSGLVAQDKNNSAAKNDKDCITHEIINQSNYVTHEIVPCGEIDNGAQVALAHSTNWVKWLALAAAVIGTLGFFALYTALKEARKDASASFEKLNIARDEQRCDFGLNLSVGMTSDWSWPANFDCHINVKNIGKTPSNSTRFSWAPIDFEGAVTHLVDGGVIGSGVAGMIEGGVFVLAPGITLNLSGIEDSKQLVFRLECFDKYGEPICIDWIIDYYVVNHNIGNQIVPHNCELHFKNITQAQTALYRNVDSPETVMAKARAKMKRSKA